MTPKEWLWIGLLAPLFAALLYGYRQLQWIEEEVDIGYSEEAKKNPFLAAEQFLHLRGLEAEVFRGLAPLDNLPETDTVLVMSSAHRTLSQRRIDALINWVERGGRLVTLAPHPVNKISGESGNRLLDPLEIYLQTSAEYSDSNLLDSDTEASTTDAQTESDELQTANGSAPVDDRLSKETENQENTDSASNDVLGQCGVDAISIRFDDDEYETWVGMSNFYEIVYAGDPENIIGSYAGVGGYLFLQIAVGDGMVSVFPNLDFWHNQNIKEYDNAHLLYLLAGKKTWILYDRDAPSLVAIIWQRGPYLVVALLLTLFLLFWHNASRFGWVVNDYAVSRRNLNEHLLASGLLVWKTGNKIALLKSIQKEIEELLKQRCESADIAGNGEKQVFTQMANKSAVPEEEIRQLLRCEEIGNEFDFIRKVQALQKIRNAL